MGEVLRKESTSQVTYAHKVGERAKAKVLVSSIQILRSFQVRKIWLRYAELNENMETISEDREGQAN